MRSLNSRKAVNEFHRQSLEFITCYINSQIIRKLRHFNATLIIKKHTIYASAPGYYVEWFYNNRTASYIYISGATNGTVFKEEGDLDSLCDEFERMFGYDV